MDHTEQLRQAAMLAKSGQTDEALTLLYALVEADPHLKHGWWGIAATSKDPTEKRRALYEVLRIAPDDERAIALQSQLDDMDIPRYTPDPEPETTFPAEDEDTDAMLETFIEMPAVQPAAPPACRREHGCGRCACRRR